MNKTNAQTNRIAKAPEPSWLSRYLTDITSVFEKPSVAVAIFLSGLIMIMFNSKEVKWVLEVLKRYGLAEELPDACTTSGRVLPMCLVFVFIGVNLYVLIWLHRLCMAIGGCIGRCYAKVEQAMFPADQPEDDNKKNKKRGKAPKPSWLTQYFTDITSVYKKPAVAIAVFVIGFAFILVASKQVKRTMEHLESFGLAEELPDACTTFGSFLPMCLVFVFIWLDIHVLIWLHRLCKEIGGYVCSLI